MSHVFPRHCKQAPPRAAGGDGSYLIGEDGRHHLDGSGGAAVSCLGHGDREVIAAILAQVERLAFAHTGFFASQPAETLADLRPIRHPPDPRRGAVPHGPHRNPVGLRAGRGQPRHCLHRQGARCRMPADRRDALQRRDLPHDHEGHRYLSARPNHYGPPDRIAGRVRRAAFDAGLICHPMPGTSDGRMGDQVLPAPPFIIEFALSATI